MLCGKGTFDEISMYGPTKVSHLRGNTVRPFQMPPEEHGFKPTALEEIVGGNAKKNAAIVREIQSGEKGPKRDILLTLLQSHQ